jgi:hypothetical protein
MFKYMIIAALVIGVSTAATAQVGSFTNGFWSGAAQGAAFGRALRGYPYSPPPPQYQEPVYQAPAYQPVPPPVNCITQNQGGGMWTTNCY